MKDIVQLYECAHVQALCWPSQRNIFDRGKVKRISSLTDVIQSVKVTYLVIKIPMVVHTEIIILKEFRSDLNIIFLIFKKRHGEAVTYSRNKYEKETHKPHLEC